MSDEIKSFKFIHLKNDNFAYGRKDDRLYNDIIEVCYCDNKKEYRILLNNSLEYVFITFNDNNVMINEISHYTWTLDNKKRGTSNFVKSDKDEKILSDIIERFGLNKNFDMQVKEIKDSAISKVDYDFKRMEFKKIYEGVALA